MYHESGDIRIGKVLALNTQRHEMNIQPYTFTQPKSTRTRRKQLVAFFDHQSTSKLVHDTFALEFLKPQSEFGTRTVFTVETKHLENLQLRLTEGTLFPAEDTHEHEETVLEDPGKFKKCNEYSYFDVILYAHVNMPIQTFYLHSAYDEEAEHLAFEDAAAMAETMYQPMHIDDVQPTLTSTPIPSPPLMPSPTKRPRMASPPILHAASTPTIVSTTTAATTAPNSTT